VGVGYLAEPRLSTKQTAADELPFWVASFADIEPKEHANDAETKSKTI
jgi:hypothetical protein